MINISTAFFAFIIYCAFLPISIADKGNRAKRFTAFGSLATIGGKVGCVVSQNKLFINGHFVKDLDVDEQTELKDYQASLDEFKTKPSFCSDKATTQYIFDGCSVQGDNIYIGDTFVRKLTSDEQRELEQFDAKFSTYQKAATADFRKKVQSAFGEHFGSLFGGFLGGGGGSEEKENDNSNGSSSLTNLEAPKAPNLCTLII
ncbi:hypothetical protein Mgra_00001885 [Meloidogyne graminicola]|uniref:Pepsin inhibitor-3-like repeated domain-containing protein n=1 Tax=Meloidogyne graminicola TaxID=189291 RepID=A0A8S9ZXU7_9BILA|nr:hypothetical protein Mgra_00001885 [Meloidogyne graminicola]